MINLKICFPEDLGRETTNTSIVCFGAGKHFPKFLQEHPNLKEKIICILDNNPVLSGKSYLGYPIYSVQEFKELPYLDFTIIITTVHYGEIFEQLNADYFFDGHDCYIDILNNRKQDEEAPFTIPKSMEKIPRKIHYCWFGRSPIPDRFLEYMESWRKYCPDYEFILWNEDNYDITKNKYMRQAYEAKKWGFVPDYARMDIVYNHGGIYLDTDVELLRNLDDLLGYEFFCGFEHRQLVAFGLGFGSVRQNPLLKKCLDYYDKLEFIRNGVLNLVPSPQYQTATLKEAGFVMNGQYQEKNGCVIFPQSVLCAGAYSPYKPPAPHTHSIHHFEATWRSEDTPFKVHVQQNIEIFKRRFLSN